MSENDSNDAAKLKKKRRSELTPEQLEIVRARDRKRKQALRSKEDLPAVVERCRKIREDKRARRAAMTETAKEEMRRRDRERKRQKRLEAKLGTSEVREDGDHFMALTETDDPEPVKQEFEINHFVHGVSQLPPDIFSSSIQKRQQRRERDRLQRASMTEEEKEAKRIRERERRRLKKLNETEEQREHRKQLRRQRNAAAFGSKLLEPVEVLLTVSEDTIFIPECKLEEDPTTTAAPNDETIELSD